MAYIHFRTLPGVAEVERRLELHARGRLADDELDELPHLVDDASRELFGITRNDTLYPMLPETVRARYRRAEWEAKFARLCEPSRDPNAFWRGSGLDLSCAEGRSLHCVHLFARQLICALDGLHPLAELRFTDHEIPRAA